MMGAPPRADRPRKLVVLLLVALLLSALLCAYLLSAQLSAASWLPKIVNLEAPSMVLAGQPMVIKVEGTNMGTEAFAGELHLGFPSVTEEEAIVVGSHDFLTVTQVGAGELVAAHHDSSQSRAPYASVSASLSEWPAGSRYALSVSVIAPQAPQVFHFEAKFMACRPGGGPCAGAREWRSDPSEGRMDPNGDLVIVKSVLVNRTPVLDDPAVLQFAPILVFDEWERYYPIDAHFDDGDVLNNKEAYDSLLVPPHPALYYRVSEILDYKVYQYWYYYAFNDFSTLGFLSDTHEHDFESVFVWVRENVGPVRVALSMHLWTSVVEISPETPFKLYVERGGHGLSLTKDARSCSILGLEFASEGRILYPADFDFLSLGNDLEPYESVDLNAFGKYRTDFPPSVWVTVGAPRVDARFYFDGSIAPRLCTTLRVNVHSPVELRVEDSFGKVTGLIGGIPHVGIQLSQYRNASAIIMGWGQASKVVVKGVGDGNYTLGLVEFSNTVGLFNTSFNSSNLTVRTLRTTILDATLIPIHTGEVHSYVLEWNGTSNVARVSRVEIDANGDGQVERVISASPAMTSRDFL